jgi:hypothetical protein
LCSILLSAYGPVCIGHYTMPRKDFLRDLNLASIPGIFPRLSDVVDGGEDGAFSLTYTPPFSTQRVYLQVTTVGEF